MGDLRPKYQVLKRNKDNASATREFTDREEPTKAFLNAVEQKTQDEYKVLTYYGVGGIGKSRLLTELYKKLESVDDTCVKVLLNFKEEKHRHPGEALIFLREKIKKTHKIKFDTFDLAYAVYWKKLNPQLSMKSNGGDLPFFEEGSFVADLVQQLDYVPFAQWVPKTLKLIGNMGRYKESLQWWHGIGKQVMEDLEESIPSEIEEMLPAFFAEDIKEYLKRTGKSAVIFIDTYEALWAKNRLQGAFHDKDSWVQELVLQLPEVLWVIAGREKIHWADIQEAWKNYLDQHLIGELSEKDSERFLSSCGIHSQEIKEVIIRGSRGYPYYLDLMVDTYTVIIDNQKRTPVLDDFSQTPQKIVDRFLYYLELHEKETLKVLSFARYWTEELFVELVSEFKTGYPIFAYKDLFRFSFINQYENRTWDMNLMMRNSLQEEIKKENPYLYKKAHQFLYKYYNEKITNKENGQISREDWPYFREAFYHGNIIMETDDFLNWFLSIGKKLQDCGQFELISSYNNELIEQISNKDNKQASAIYQYFGGIGLLQGNYELALELLQKAATIYAKLPTKKREYLKCCNDLAEIMIQMTNFDQAYDYFSNAINSYQTTNSEELEVLLELALVYIRLGKLDIRFSKYENSTEHYKTAISLCNQVLEISPESAVAYGRLALSYEKLGELHSTFNSNEQRQYYLQSIEHYKNAIEREYDVRTLANMGLAYKRLGESYELKTETIDKLKSYEEAISIFNEVVEKAPDFIDVLEKKGHALVDYLKISIELEQYNRAIECFNEAIETFEAVLELSPKQGGAQNRIGSAYRELAIMYIKKNEPTLAIPYLQKALEIYDLLKSTSNYIYIDNSMAKTYELLGDFYKKHNDITRATENYKLAINSFQAMLKRAPKLQEAIEGIERIRKFLNISGN